MPLKSGSSQATISANIKELHHGNTYAKTAAKHGKNVANKQAIAIAEKTARGRADGGSLTDRINDAMVQANDETNKGWINTPNLPDKLIDTGVWKRHQGTTNNQKIPSYTPYEGRAFGGVAPMLGQASNMMPPGSNPAMPPQMATNGIAAPMQPSPMMGLANGINAPMAAGMAPRPYAAGGGIAPIKSTFTGPIVSSVPGRTDKHFGHVPSGSYVIPADIVSGHGQGNSMAGMDSLHKLFRMGSNNSLSTRLPYGGNHLAKGNKFSAGGSERHKGDPVPVRLAGGEIVLAPHHVQETMSRLSRKKLSLDESHKEMDKWVINERKKLRKTLATLPGPARD